jgi:hypothetical protein
MKVDCFELAGFTIVAWGVLSNNQIQICATKGIEAQRFIEMILSVLVW